MFTDITLMGCIVLTLWSIALFCFCMARPWPKKYQFISNEDRYLDIVSYIVLRITLLMFLATTTYCWYKLLW